MVDPVVSTRFGPRPLVEVPAMQVSNRGSVEVPTLEVSVSPSPVRVTYNPFYGSGIHNPPTTLYTVPQAPFVIARQYPSAPPGFVYNMQPREYYYGPNGELVIPPPVYNPPSWYPGVVNPAVPGYVAPAPAVVRVPYHNYGLTISGFNITCELEYGQIMSIDVRDSIGEFRGIPEFLKTELLRTYGAHPYTKVKIKLEGGEFHIFATHDKLPKRRHRRRYRENDSDSESDRYYDKYGPYPEWKSEIESYTSGVRPRNPGDRPRGIVHERGWNRFR